MAYIKEIQVCGGKVVHSLYDACEEYIKCVGDGTDREKISFAILLDDDTAKHITIREWDDSIQAYGDFEGMPDAYEWAKRVIG